jgi:hypothetical protein
MPDILGYPSKVAKPPKQESIGSQVNTAMLKAQQAQGKKIMGGRKKS